MELNYTISKERKEKIVEFFPFKYSDDLTLYLDKILYIKDYNCYVALYDSEGYKYKTEFNHIRYAKENKQMLNRFFKRNPFTYDNINNFFKLNNIDLHINGDNLPVSGIARKKLDFTTSEGEVLKISWNQIQREPSLFSGDSLKEFIQGYKVRNMSKEVATKTIHNMQSRLDRPVNAYDFSPKQKDGIGIKTIYKYWGSVENMQKELGLTNTNNYGRLLTEEQCFKEIEYICNDVFKNEDRKLITYKDFNKYGTYFDARPYSQACKSINTTLRQHIESLGYELQSAGVGFNHVFNDCEQVFSMYEYEFSNFLRNSGLVYNRDYYRDTMYRHLNTEYKGEMNCDYEIHFQGRIFYVELAGFLIKKKHQECYRDNVPIKSETKEKYRLALVKKKEIFEKENLEYYILLPDDMNENTYKSILNNNC